MRICIFGAGAIGSYVAAKLAISGAGEISVIGRGTHFDAIEMQGLRLKEEGQTKAVPPVTAVARASLLPQQDIVFVTVKAHGLSVIAEDIADLLAPNGVAVFANNGIPWWWNHGLPGQDGALSEVDAGAALWTKVGPQRALGCVLYSANHISAPGTVEHFGNNKWLIAEPSNEESQRARRVVQLMRDSQMNAELSNDLRAEIWKKLLRNAPFNSLCALTRLSAGDFPQVPGLVELAQTMTDEVVKVAAAKGWDLPAPSVMDVVKSGGLINSAVPNPQALPSMLHDALNGRQMEVAAILGQIRQFATEERLAVPAMSVVHSILAGLDTSFCKNVPSLSRTLSPANV